MIRGNRNNCGEVSQEQNTPEVGWRKRLFSIEFGGGKRIFQSGGRSWAGEKFGKPVDSSAKLQGARFIDSFIGRILKTQVER